MLRYLMIVATLIASSAAYAVEAGDVVWLSSNGVGLTVTEVQRVNRESVRMTAIQMEANASEFCNRYEQLTDQSPTWKKCIADGIQSTPTTIAVNCRTKTIILGGSAGGSGSYRRGNGGGPWTSVANPNWIIQGDEVYGKVCSR